MLQHGVLVAVNAKKDVYVHTTNNQSSSSFSFYSARVYLLLSKQHKQMIEAREQFNLWILEWEAEMWILHLWRPAISILLTSSAFFCWFTPPRWTFILFMLASSPKDHHYPIAMNIATAATLLQKFS